MVTAIAACETSFDYAFLPVSDLQVKTKEDPKTGKKTVTDVMVQGESLKPTDRFWVSLFSRYGFNSAFFKYYDHEEVFTRISEVEKSDRMRLCIERDENGGGKILGVSNPSRPIVVFDELMDMLGRYHSQNVTYANGIVESTHTPRNGSSQFQIGGDDFANRFLLATPIDGYGAPNIYLSLLRTICMNGVVGYSKAFKSSLALGKGDDDVSPALTRAIDGFGNEEGYSALRQRLEAATKSWASVWESNQLYKLLVRLHANKYINDSQGAIPEAPGIAKWLATDIDTGVVGMSDDSVGSPILKAWHRCVSDVSKTYGLASLEALSAKRQRTLPVKATVYDIMNFATEVASHYADPVGARMLQGWIGNTVSEEYDLESTLDKFSDFKDFFIEQKVKANLTGSSPDVHPEDN